MGVGVAVDGGNIGTGVIPGTVPVGMVGSGKVMGAGEGDSAPPDVGGTGGGPHAVSKAAAPIMVTNVFILRGNRLCRPSQPS